MRIDQIFLFLLIVFLISSAFPAVLHAQVSVQPAEHEPVPWHRVNREAFENMMTVGLATAGAFWPPAAGIKKAYDGFELFRKSETEAVEYRTTIKENDLLLIDNDAKHLEELRQTGRRWWNDREAMEARERLLQRAKENEGAFSFAAKAFFSPYEIYAVTKLSAFNYFGRLVGEKAARMLGVGESTRLAFRGEGEIRKHLTRTQWKKLKAVAKFGERLSHDLAKALLAKIAENITLKQLGIEIDARVQEVMRRLPPPSDGGGRRMKAEDLRVEVVNEPQIYVPVVLPGVTVQTYRDPVVNSAAVQSEIISTRYEVDTAPVTAGSEPSRNTMGGHNIYSDLSRYRNPNWDGIRLR